MYWWFACRWWEFVNNNGELPVEADGDSDDDDDDDDDVDEDDIDWLNPLLLFVNIWFW